MLLPRASLCHKVFMKFPSSVFSILDEHVGKIGELAKFVVDEQGRLSIKNGSFKIPNSFSSSDIDDVQKFADSIGMIAKGESKNQKKSFDVSEKVSEWLVSITRPLRHGQMFAEMALVYAVAQTEAFMKGVIVELLSTNSEMLRSSKAITYEEIASYRTIKNLHRGLAEREVGALSYEGLDGIDEYFFKKMQIKLSDFDEWQLLREYFYRRNVIIHNKSIADNKYVTKTKMGKLGGMIFTTMDDVIKASDIMKRFMLFSLDRIKNKISGKSAIHRKSRKFTVRIGHVE